MWIIVMLVVLLSGCATGTSGGLSSLGREVNVTPLRGQAPEQIKQDDRECEAWTRATKGKDEPLPSAELRYAACVIARGYQADVYGPAFSAFGGTTGKIRHHVSHPMPRTLETLLAEWHGCRMDKTSLNPWTAAPFSDVTRGQNALTCLQERAYKVELYQ